MGGDIISAFENKGKKSSFPTWEILPEITGTFVKMSTCPLSIYKEDEQRIEQFIVLLYDRSSTSFDVDMTRKKLFSQRNSLFDKIPPTSAALKYHIRRAAFQASIIWGQALEQVPDQHCPEQWGWKKNTDGVLEIYWTDLSAISESCAKLCKCGCKKQCTVLESALASNHLYHAHLDVLVHAWISAQVKTTTFFFSNIFR